MRTWLQIRIIGIIIASWALASCASQQLVDESDALRSIKKEVASEIYQSEVRFKKVMRTQTEGGEKFYLVYLELFVRNKSSHALSFRESDVRFFDPAGNRAFVFFWIHASGEFTTYTVAPGESLVVTMHLSLRSYEASTIEKLVFDGVSVSGQNSWFQRNNKPNTASPQ